MLSEVEALKIENYKFSCFLQKVGVAIYVITLLYVPAA